LGKDPSIFSRRTGIRIIADGIGSDRYCVSTLAASDERVGLAPIAYLTGITGSNSARPGTYTFPDGPSHHADSHS
jgi:hypothetical protein